MLLYYNDRGKLTTIIPHGEFPHQCGNLNIYVAFEKDSSIVNKNSVLWLRYKLPDSSEFSADYVLERVTLNDATFNIVENEGIVVFKRYEEENVGNFVDGREYRMFHINLSETTANRYFGRLTLSLSIYEYNEENDSSSLKQTLDNATFLVEKTLGLFPYKGIGMNRTEYETLKEKIAEYIIKVDNLKTDTETIEFIRDNYTSYPENDESLENIFEKVENDLSSTYAYVDVNGILHLKNALVYNDVLLLENRAIYDAINEKLILK